MRPANRRSSFLFLITAAFQVVLARHHKKEKRYGPSPSNNYTSGLGRRGQFWRRNKRNTRDAELATTGLASDKHAYRPSADTGYTGSTVNPGYGHNHTTGTATNY